jgi:hypothetical protein
MQIFEWKCDFPGEMDDWIEMAIKKREGRDE